MKTSAPNWKPATLRSIVRASARELEVRNTAWMVLGELLRCVNYRNGTARISTPSLCENLGRCEKAVKTGLQILRETGVIYWVGRAGRGRTALYGFGYTLGAVKHHNNTCKRGAEFTPLCVGQYIEKEGNLFPKGGKIIPERRVKITPPSPSVPTYQQKEDEDAPSRGEVGDTYGLTFGDLADHIGRRQALAIWDDVSDPKAEVATFDTLLRGFSYGEARSIWDRFESKGALRAAENEEGEKTEMEDAQ